MIQGYTTNIGNCHTVYSQDYSLHTSANGNVIVENTHSPEVLAVKELVSIVPHATHLHTVQTTPYAHHAIVVLMHNVTVDDMKRSTQHFKAALLSNGS